MGGLLMRKLGWWVGTVFALLMVQCAGHPGYAPVFERQPHVTSGKVGVTSKASGEVPVVLINTPVTLSALATGDSAPRYQWKQEGVVLPNATGSAYSFTPTKEGEMHFSVVASNGAGQVESQACILDVRAQEAFMDVPKITLDPVSCMVEPQGKAVFQVNATGGQLTYQWYKKKGEKVEKLPGATAKEWVIPRVEKKDHDWDFYVEVANAKGKATSQLARLSISLPVVTFRVKDGMGKIRLQDKEEIEHIITLPSLGADAPEAIAVPGPKKGTTKGELNRVKDWREVDKDGKVIFGPVIADQLVLKGVERNRTIELTFLEGPKGSAGDAPHKVHMPLANAKCVACHPSVTDPKAPKFTKDIKMPDYAMLNSPAPSYDTTTRTCLNVSCHGGVKTPDWYEKMDVKNNCRACHLPQPEAKNAYISFGGTHDKHLGLRCIECHDFSKLNANKDPKAPNKGKEHYGDLKKHELKGIAKKTLLVDDKVGTPIKKYTEEKGVCSCVSSCHNGKSLVWQKKELPKP